MIPDGCPRSSPRKGPSGVLGKPACPCAHGRDNHPPRGDANTGPGGHPGSGCDRRSACASGDGREGEDVTDTTAPSARAAARAVILPLALAQFIASYAATNMNVAISAIAEDLGTTVAGVQTAITLFTLTMAALMIPGSKRCFVLGLIVYGVGGLVALLSFGLPQLIVGYSLLEGVGSALMIPPIYILVTVAFPDVKSRAKY